jgi:hypothetical protein
VTLPDAQVLRARLAHEIADLAARGRAVDGMAAELDALPASFDALVDFADRLAAAALMASRSSGSS